MLSPRARRRGTRVATLALGLEVCIGVLTGCTAKDGASEGLPTSGPEELPASVCPSCGPSAGGETGDFPGTPDACTRFRLPIEVDDEEARALGYDISEVRRQLARAFELPFSWGEFPRLIAAQNAANARYEAEPPSGYSLDETAISLRFRAADVVVLERLHPVLCDGTGCRDDADSVPSMGCQPTLNIDIQVDVRTADNAVHGRLEGRAMKVGNGALSAVAFADLADVSGRLSLSPNTDLGAISGTLSLQVQFGVDRADGTLTPTIAFRSDSATMYMPLVGQFRGSTFDAPASDVGSGGEAVGRPRPSP